MHPVNFPNSFTEWRRVTRRLLETGCHPHDVIWQTEEQASLFEQSAEIPQRKVHSHFSVPREFLELARTVATHRSNNQWPYLYNTLWRLTHGERTLLSNSTDRDVHQLKSLQKEIKRDIHKMHAFVRFRLVSQCPKTQREQFIAWFEPDHKILRLTASFFRKRFAGMDWSILTPDGCMHWNGAEIHFTPGVDRSAAPDADAQDHLWRSYYKSIFNPARLKLRCMQSEMPKKYWKNLPEAPLIEELISTASNREKAMLAAPPSLEKPAPQNAYLKKLSKLSS